ncbi:TonB-dependent receptor [Vogesella sp. LIG4]|uniref:TonB-dependent receptor n=1 Tax=Vogesella sp. LIG4 TaxID=1192162 RepID=UPI0008202397|nr:TonB-dependent receptor [Vogesella sp. LIG4]SCK12041.1 iron complex outermembrane recepter protein [Vogesella sp. LIG4]
MFNTKPLAALVALACAPAAMAATVTQLDEVVVTATRVADKASELPANVTVITAADIASSPARTVQELLSAVAGVHLFNMSGSASGGTVDLRGFGVTGVSNTLILVDGVKQNTNDLAVPNLAGIPLQAIERIEVVRGSGAVAYGGGTTGGVVNIITRNGFKDQPSVRATFTMGSQDLKQLDVAVHQASAQVALDAYVQSMTGDNYRRNNAERNDNGGISATWRHDGGDVRFYARNSNQGLRLPGGRQIDPAAGINQFASDSRGTSSPNDYAETRAQDYGLQARQELAGGLVYFDLAQRHKNTFTNWGSAHDQRSADETNTSLRYERELGAHRLAVGVDGQNSATDVDGTYATSRIKQQLLGVFADALLRPQAGTTVNVGVRNQHVDDDVSNLSSPSHSYQKQQELNAWQLGIRQALTPSLDVYAKLGQSFRIANADEQSYAAAPPLLPQVSHDKEVGVAWLQGGSSVRAALFRYDLNNEIHYNPLSYFNVNLDPTRRQGVELEGKTQLAPQWQLNGNLTWQQATFRSGVAGGVDLAGNTVPMVPHWLANVGLTWLPQQATRVGLELQYVGKQRMDNDEANQFATQLSAYTLVNLKLSHQYSKHVDVSLAVNNLLDKRYASYGYREDNIGSTGKYDLLPGSGRTMQASLTLSY